MFRICIDKGLLGVKRQERHLRYSRQLSQQLSLPNDYPLPQSEIWRVSKLLEIKLVIFGDKQDGVKEIIIDEPPDSLDASWNYLNLHQGDVAYSIIRDVNVYRDRWPCSKCSSDFPSANKLKMHREKACRHSKLVRAGILEPTAPELCYVDNNLKVLRRFRPGVYHNKATLAEQLHGIGVVTPQQLGVRVNPYHCVLDIEARLPEPTINSKFGFLQKHIPVSVAIASNVDGYECHSFLDVESSSVFMTTLVQYLLELRSKMIDLSEQRYRSVLDRVEDLRQVAALRARPYFAKKIERVQGALEKRLNQLTIYTWNGSSYDLPCLLRHGLAHFIYEATEHMPQPIKRGNDYIYLECPELRFVDLLCLLSGKIPLRRFLTMHGVAELQKSHFPHGAVKERSDLFNQVFPSYKDFWNVLKGVNSLEEDHLAYRRLVDRGLSEGEAMKALGLKDTPKTGEAVYLDLVEMWRRGNFQDLGQILRSYNEQDVVSLIPCVENLETAFEGLGIDVKAHFTAASMGFPRLIRSTKNDAHFFVKLDASAHALLRSANRGGLAQVFNRFALVGHTKILEHRYGPAAKTVKRIVQLDFNSLYSTALGRMASSCVGYYLTRNAEDDFAADKVMGRCRDTLGWLTFESRYNYKQHIRTALSRLGEFNLILSGGEGEYFVDGWMRQGNDGCGIAFEGLGCVVHGADCCRDPDAINPLTQPPQTNREVWRKTQDRLRRIREHKNVSELITMTTCELKRKRREEPFFDHYMKSFSCGPNPVDTTMSETRLLQLVEEGRIHGYLLADYEVGEDKMDDFYQWPPFTQQTTVGRDDLDPWQQQYAMDRHLLTNLGRTVLASHLSVTSYLAHTECVAWFLRKGIRVSNVKTLLQFERVPFIFSGWLDELIAQREGAADKGDTAMEMVVKLLGNSAYGKAGMKRETHENVKFVAPHEQRRQTTDSKAIRWFDSGPVENPTLLLEVTKRKQRINEDLPLQLFIEVQELSKLKLQQFLQDVAAYYFRPGTYMYMSSDTDSVSIAMSEDSFPELCKPELRAEFERIQNDIFVPESGPEAKLLAKKAGLLKMEMAHADLSINLSPKAYTLVNFNSGVSKSAHKGWPLTADNDHMQTVNSYITELFQWSPERPMAVISGFRVGPNGHLYTYKTQRGALGCLNVKWDYCSHGSCHIARQLPQHVRERLYPYPCSNTLDSIKQALGDKIQFKLV